MKDVSATQKDILDYLLQNKEGATADELVQIISVTKTAIKSHLDTLLGRGYLKFLDESQGPGRPKRRYFLSDDAAEAFPKQYSWLSLQLLKELSESLNHEDLKRLMLRLAKRVYQENHKELEAPTPLERITKLATLMNALGYKAELKSMNREKKYYIQAYNCVYHNVAKEHPELCEFDRQLIGSSTKLKTTLEDCIAKGGSVCRFCLCE